VRVALRADQLDDLLHLSDREQDGDGFVSGCTSKP
jgi:hypothetical protein